MIKVLHIHSDRKFVRNSYNLFSNNIFQNHIIIWGRTTNYSFPNMEKALFFDHKHNEIPEIIDLCKNADLVVIYNLDVWKIELINRMPKNIVILWRFFGSELYGRIPQFVYSKQTHKAKQTPFAKVRTIKKKLNEFLYRAKHNTTLEAQFNKALVRINFFIGLSKMEHQYLRGIWPNLPDYIQHPYTAKLTNSVPINSKMKSIVLGNSRSSANNHLDVLNIIDKCKNKHQYSFYLLFSYGEKSNYSKSVKHKATNIEEVTIIDKYMPPETFKDIYEQVSAFVMNGYRQMAMGSVYLSIRNNVKIYLNEQNIIYNWLKKEGFVVFSINDFVNDLETGNIKLTENEAATNHKSYNNLLEKYSLSDFEKYIIHSVVKQ